MSRKIGMVEDEVFIAEDVRGCLEKKDFDVSWHATSYDEAVKHAQKELPNCLIMDINIKGQSDGIDTAIFFHKEYGIPSVFLTAFSDDENIERAKEAEPAGFLAKPFRESELLAAAEIGCSLGKQRQETRTLNHALAGQIKQAVILIDQNYNLKFVNRLSIDLFKTYSRDFIGKSWEVQEDSSGSASIVKSSISQAKSEIPLVLRSKLGPNIDKVLETGETCESEIQVWSNENNRTVPLAYECRPLRSKNETVEGVLIQFDLTRLMPESITL